MFTNFAKYWNFGHRLAGAATPSFAFPSDGRAGRPRCARVRRQNTVICRWHISTATGKPERVWSVISVDTPATRDLDDAPTIIPPQGDVDTWITPAQV